MIESYNKTLFYENGEAKISLKVEKPEKLYKYYSLSENSLNNLKDQNIHFTHPYNLNDLMDGNLQLWDLEEFYKDFAYETKGSMDELTFNKEIIQKHSFEYYKNRGVLCLTESFDNNLFWPHYTTEQGFCIEFNSSTFLESFSNADFLFFPISYEPLKKIDFKENIRKEIIQGKAKINAKLPLLYALSFKDTIWAYEKEWRILLRKKNLGEVFHPLNPISDIEFQKEIKDLRNRNIDFNYESINKVILSNLFFHKNRFNFQVRQEKKDIYFFRKKFTNENNILYKFFEELKENYNDKIFQLDKDYEKETNRFKSKLFYSIKILELDFDKIVIERKLNCG